MNSRNSAFLLATLAAIIYGINFTVAKEVMPYYIKPYAFILVRVFGATILFWIVGMFIKKEKIGLNDFSRILMASIFGTVINMLAFFKGLSLTSPINASVIMVTTPILVLTFASLFLKEKATKLKLSGIFIGMAGAILLIVYGRDIETGTNAVLGNFLVFINASSYALYLILIKNLTKKFHPLTIAKWLYLFGLVFVIPFGIHEFMEIDFVHMPKFAVYRIAYVVLFTTFFAYMFNLFAIRKLKPTTLSIFIYLQPVIASFYALFVGSDSLSFIKITATILIFSGVYLVTRKPNDEPA